MNLWLIPFFPLIGFLIIGLFGRRLPKQVINVVAIGSVMLSFGWACKVALALATGDAASAEITKPTIETYFTWIQSGSLRIDYALTADRLSALMLLIVTGVGLLIHTYAAGYMDHEGGYYRFFSYLNLFMFFMLTLVLANNYLLMFVGWEGVGLCSYLLIGFYFKDQNAGYAGNKAFIVNRIGDFGFMLALLLLFKQFGSLDIPKVLDGAHAIPSDPGTGWLFWACLLLFVGATGKSAQLPLYVWLPDAMAGPTPVSALIHAATMVTAGIYMIARSAPLFKQAPLAMEIIAIVGLATAVFAAIIGIAQTDIKKVFAYSTVSQLGYMFLALGVGAFSASLFHVMTHAFFKAVLFLGAGSVIHALNGEQDLLKMGGLRTKMPWTFYSLMAAGLAIAGFPFTSGFFSKDEILIAANAHAPWMFWVGAITAGITAFYVFRALFLTFFGSYRGKEHPHEAPMVMALPVAVLAVLSLVGGFLSVPHWLNPQFGIAEGEVHNTLVQVVATGAGLLGIALAYYFYVLSPRTADSLAVSFGPLYRTVYHKFYIDEIYNALIVKPLLIGSKHLLWHLMDEGLVDGIVRGLGGSARNIGGVAKRFQSGYIRSYATWVVLGSVLVLIVVGLAGIK